MNVHDRTCRRGHKVSGENQIARGKYTVCRECFNKNRRDAHERARKKKLASKIELSEDVLFVLQNPDSLPNWDGIKTWILKTWGQVKSRENANLK